MSAERPFYALHRIIKAQALATISMALLFLVADNLSMWSALYGGLMALLGTLLLLWYQSRIERVGNDAQRSLAILYRCAFERFAVGVALFAFGLGIMGLTPLPLLSGFGVGQIIFLINGSR